MTSFKDHFGLSEKQYQSVLNGLSASDKSFDVRIVGREYIGAGNVEHILTMSLRYGCEECGRMEAIIDPRNTVIAIWMLDAPGVTAPRPTARARPQRARTPARSKKSASARKSARASKGPKRKSHRGRSRRATRK